MAPLVVMAGGSKYLMQSVLTSDVIFQTNFPKLFRNLIGKVANTMCRCVLEMEKDL